MPLLDPSLPPPPALSLFSSVGSYPLQLLTSSTCDQSLATESFVVLVRDYDDQVLPCRLPSITSSSSGRTKHCKINGFLSPEAFAAHREELNFIGGVQPTTQESDEGQEDGSSQRRIPMRKGDIRSPVLHIQSPSVLKTSVTFGGFEEGSGQQDHRDRALGITYPWIHFQLKNLSQLFMLEIGLQDKDGRKGRVRVSTFQSSPRLHLHRSAPMLHLPLTLPTLPSPHAAASLTPWYTLTLHLPSLIPFFSTLRPSISATDQASDFVAAPPPSTNSKPISVAYVRIHANCRLRRIWFTEDGRAEIKLGAGPATRVEMGLFAAPGID